ncbi:hypothetical protein DDJ48_01600 [Mycobacteroides abscessus]|uniref:hypothetical protein n=1 Tax=Mycobacteroides abscessus TaxID=36809 RepID=UPI000D3EA8B1|nr:hypothetical protein [Mycobacteroides abscessus]PVA44654.1 hypothetical protein DDJ48_01600 [Mycobacteroides abscessus]RIT93263.1 hypothetical protein D2F00_20855 [Mycobacteroides abscessus]
MEQVDGRWAYTLQEAAAEIDRSRQRVNQLIAEGALTGPSYLQPGRLREPAGAPRVWKDSVERYLATRNQKRQRQRPSADTSDHAAADLAFIRRWIDGRERSLRAASQHLKVSADILREQLADERAHNRASRTLLLNTVVKSAAAIQALAADLDRYERDEDKVFRAYSDALTQLLGEDWPIHGE